MKDSIYKRLLTELVAGQKAVLLTELDNEGCSKMYCCDKKLFTEDNLHDENIGDSRKDIYQNVVAAFKSGELQFIDWNGKHFLIEPFYPEPRLIILGGGHIAKPLAEFGAQVGFAVTIVDDRLSFANRARFPEAEQVICESFEKCFDRLTLNLSAFVVIVTRGHRHDLKCLQQVLKYDCAYIGMIGSKRRVKSVKEQLASEGYCQELLDKVNAPIGLDIGAVTPAEIAISIIAQVISFRRLKNPLHGDDSSRVNWMEFDRELLTELGEGKDEPKAIVTVISTKGSVPRRAGAKMIVWPDGRTLGSIGGGCSEGAVIRTALDVIRIGGCQIQNLDMTSSAADDDGMVCGGVMQVVIEGL